MVELHGEDLLVRLTVDDAGTARDAGASFARALAGAVSADFAAALAEQGELIRQAILEAGFTAGQARLAAERFEAAAQTDWARIADAGGAAACGRA